MDRLKAQQTLAQQTLRDGVWDRLRAVARPDSRLHYDFAHMHPDFEGSEAAAQRFFGEELTEPLGYAFTAPDNALNASRYLLLSRSVKLVVSTYCMRRGFRLLDPATIAATDHAFAATLDGLERFGTPVSVAEIASLGRVDLALCGAAAVAPNGVRHGRSYQYFDIEWGLLTEIGVVGEQTSVAVVVHDVQVTTDKMVPMPREAVPDFIVTPGRTIRVKDRPRRPVGVDWGRLDAEEIEQMPALIELQQARGMRR